MTKFHYFPHRAGKAVLAGSLGIALAFSLGAPAYAATDPDMYQGSSAHRDKTLTASMRNAEGTVSAFVQFKGPGAFEATQPSGVRTGQQDPVKAVAAVKAVQADVEGKAASVASETSGQVLYTAHNALRGVALTADAEALRNLANRSDVVKISRIVPKERFNAATDVDTAALASWTNAGKTGKGVRIAVVDSGLDYTHADFGGPGTQEGYEKAKSSTDIPSKESGLYDPAKFVGGYDFAGDNYDAGGEFGSEIPQPDSNPLDCREGGHGTHVAGSAAGFGVDENGKTFRGDYTKLSAEDVKKMKIGPGSAPQAELISMRVFGCEGTTNVTGEALDRTLDPNGDGDFSDRANIVNLSLGSDFGPIDDPENDIVNALNRQGILSVIAAGNANGYGGVGDTYSNLGNPANTVSALTVANSIGSNYFVDQAEITAPESIKGRVTGDYSRDFNYAAASDKQLSGTVVAAPEENKYACEVFPAGTDFGGKWVLIDWYDGPGSFPCGSKKRFDNIEAAGGKGVVLTSNVMMEDGGIAGNETIPGTRLNAEDSAKVRKATENGGTFDITLKNEWIESVSKPTNALDTLNSSSARGQHGSNGFVKPDVAAPGTNIMSAGVGKGNGGTVMTGTSMSTPHVAGVAALVLQAHQNYSPANIKAAIMNTATHDVKTADGATYAVDRVGTGRIDAQAAVNTNVLVYNTDNPHEVSDSFGVVEAKPGDPQLVLKRKFTVDNFDSAAHTYNLSYDSSVMMPGVSITVDPMVSVGVGKKAEFTVTATVDPSALQKTADPALELIQLNQARQFIAQESGRIKLTEAKTELRVPVQIAPKPVSDMSAKVDAAELAKNGTTAPVTLSGTELNQGGYTGMLGAFELGAKSDRMKSTSLPIPSLQQIDLQYVGASSDAPILAAAGKDTSDAMLGFGISTWANWDVLSWAYATEVSIDVDANQRPDFFLTVDRVEGFDMPLAVLRGFVNGEPTVLSMQPINGALGDIDTNLMDSNTMVLPVLLADLGITADNADKVSYKVDTYSWYVDGATDSTDWIKYNPLKPAVWFDGAEPATDVLYKDSAATKLKIHRDSSKDAAALFLHMHNGTGDLAGIKKGEDGGRSQVVELAAATPSQPTKPVTNPRFTDVPADYPFYNEIAWLATKGITTGYPDGTFRPQENVQRGAMAAFFYRLAGSPAYTAPAVSPFKDVPTTHPFYKEIAWMKEQGITTGFADGTFRPQDDVNRDAMAAFFYRMAGSPEYTAPSKARFSDVPVNSQFYKEVSWLASVGVTNGWDDGTFRPLSPIHRDAMAAFIYRYDKNVQH